MKRMNSSWFTNRTSSKRRREMSPDCDDDDNQFSSRLCALPIELIENIFSYLKHEEISRIRHVCRRFNVVGQRLLNNAFMRLQNQTAKRFQEIKSQMPRRESKRQKHPLMRECDIVETIHMRLSMLQMTFRKHIELKHCCFFPGAILDEIEKILHHVKTSSPQNVGRAYKVSDELFDLTTMAMEYFKENIEPRLPDVFNALLGNFDSPTTLAAKLGLQSPLLDDSLDLSKLSSSSSLNSSPKRPSQTRKYERIRTRYKRLQRRYRSVVVELASVKRNIRESKRKSLRQQRIIDCRFKHYNQLIDNQSKRIDSLLLELYHSGCLPKTVISMNSESNDTNEKGNNIAESSSLTQFK